LTIHQPKQSSADLDDLLAQRLASARAELDAITVRWNQISNLRLVLAALGAVAIFLWIREPDTIRLVATVFIVLGFVTALVWHRRVGARRSLVFARSEVRHRAIASRARDWDALPEPRRVQVDDDHPYAGDLDLVGRASIQQLIDTTQTPAGQRALIEWLLHPTTRSDVTGRQDAARTLLTAVDWREDLQAFGLNRSGASGDPGVLLGWLERQESHRVSPRTILAALAAIGTVAVLIVYAAGLIGGLWVVPFVLVNALVSLTAPRADRLNLLATHQRSLTQYRAVLPIVEAMPGDAQRLDVLRRELGLPHSPASAQLATLDRALAFVIPPSTLLWFPLQLFVNWDLLLSSWLERWAARHGREVRRWIEVVGETEALAAMTELAWLNPGWSWPVLSENSDALTAREIGHPLISDQRRVANDVQIGPAGSVLIVTGSNMAGKSTLLRAVGLNAVLAKAGGPVCASELVLPDLDVWTSVRIRDSLEHGVSLYMAELLRLKQIVDAANERPILYLLDEILHGTNTAERRIAARVVIRQLIATGSIGAVSTHDLELLDDESLARQAVPVHLLDQVVDTPDGPEMHFDYRLRSGLAPSSNALRLLKLVGLGEALEAKPADSTSHDRVGGQRLP
jgi:hypothetical protein